LSITGKSSTQDSSLSDFDNAVKSYLLGNKQNAFDNSQNFLKFYPFLQLLKLDNLALTPEERIFRNLEYKRVRGFTETDFREMVSFLKYSAAYTSSYLGHGDAKGTRIFADVSVKPQRSATFNDFLQLDNVIKLQNLIEGIIFDYKQRVTKSPNLLSAANNNIAGGSEVSISTRYLSSIAVPFQDSLEAMARKYLGDSRRWYELVTVNKLQPPFFDQNGTKVPLLSPGNANNLTVDGTLASDCAVGSKVSVGSLKFREQTRVIERQVLNADGTMTLFLSGDQDLTNLLPSQKAYVRIRKPNTVYDGSFILIPLDVASTYAKMPTPTSDVLRRLDADLLAFGVDIKRDEKTGDIVTDGSGNFQMIYGLDAVRQAVYWAIRTTRGELPWHRTFGVPATIGNKFMGSTSEAAVFFQTLDASLRGDARFKSISLQKIRTTGNSLSLDIIVTLSGSKVPIPLSFVV
jgi:hypothetical protein